MKVYKAIQLIGETPATKAIIKAWLWEGNCCPAQIESAIEQSCTPLRDVALSLCSQADKGEIECDTIKCIERFLEMEVEF